MSATIIRLFLLFTLTIFPGGQDQSRRELKHKRVVGTTSEEAKKGDVALWALIIGISNYKYGDQDIDGLRIANLAYATTDAKSIYDFLQSEAGGGFQDVSKGGHMLLLKDEEATKSNVEAALYSFKEAKPDDYFVIYVAGHGHIETRKDIDPATGKETEDLVPYFVVHDTDPRDFKGTAINMGWFRQTIVSEIPAKRGLVLLDTCHSGGIVQPWMRKGQSELANGPFINELKKIDRGIGFISASEALEPSFEQPDLDHGVFTYCLLEALRGAADEDRDGMVVFNEAVGFLRNRVPSLTKGRQHPYPYTTWINANYIPLSIVRYTGVAPTAKSATLVIRNPAVEGVEVAIDDEPAQSAPVAVEVSTQISAGAHKISYSNGASKNELQVTIGPGETKEVEIKLCFTEIGEEDKPAGLPVSVYLPDKEPSTQAKTLFHEGVDKFNRQKFEQARDLFNRAIQANGGGYSRALVYRGRAEQSLGRYKEAVASFTEALRLKPTDFETLTLLAEAKFVAGGDVKEVYDNLRCITTTYPTFAFAHVVLGDVLLWRGETVRAERELRRAVALNPTSPPAHLILADALTHQDINEKQKEATVEAERALRLFEELSRKQVTFKGGSISHLIFGGGRYANAPAMAEAHYMLAKTLTRAVQYDPNFAERKVYLDRARLSIQEGKRLAQSLHDKVRMAQVLHTSALNYFLKEDLANAITDGEEALRLSESLPELKALVHYALFQAYQSKQRCADAAKHLQSYIEIYKSHMSSAELDQYKNELERLKNCADANRQKE